jgi:hypothetical protein
MNRNLKDDIIAWIPFVGLLKYQYVNTQWNLVAVVVHGLWTGTYIAFFILRLLGIINY